MCHAYISGIVQLNPTGPLYIAINTERIINCSITGGTFFGWTVLFMNRTQQHRSKIGEIVPGINLTSKTTNSSSLVMNTTDTSIIGLRCIATSFEVDVRGNIQTIRATINLTIYGMLIKFLRSYDKSGMHEYLTTFWNLSYATPK